MSAYGGSFESASSIEEKKESKRRAREQLLAQAKEEYEKEERRKEQRRLRGEDTWMLNDVTERLAQIEQESSGKKKKKDKHHKKSKKEKKKKSKKQKSERKEGSSDSSSDSEGQWVEAAPSIPADEKKAWKIQTQSPERKAGPELERDEWMTLDFMSVRATSAAALRAEKQKEKTLERERAEAVEKAQLQTRELNPFWKDGGTGLPPEEGDVTLPKKVQNVEDGGLSWLKKSLQRMKEQAEREKRALEDIVAERYGSMENFESKMKAAEKVVSQNSKWEQVDRTERWRKPRQHGYDSQKSPRSDCDRGDERSKAKYANEHSRDRAHRARENHSERTKEEERDLVMDRRGVGRRDFLSKRLEDASSSSNSSSKLKGMFLKPSEEDEGASFGTGFRPQRNKPEFIKPVTDDALPTVESHREEKCRTEDSKMSQRAECKKESPEKMSVPDSPPSPRPETSSPQIQILTEEEMNKLGAKIVKAEIMGNMELASRLRAQLEQARQQRQNRQQPPVKDKGEQSKDSSSREEQEVLLVRTDQSGRAWPVNASGEPAEPRGGRRKRSKVETHADRERVRYFHDDDNQSLHDLVKREKMGTAEDQNKAFMRMASKLREKTDQDYYTLDDMFVSSAAKKEHANEEEERERQQAISEHRKLAARMEKCPFCFDNAELPKHLIIAIGVKVRKPCATNEFFEGLLPERWAHYNMLGKFCVTKEYIEGELPENCGNINKPGMPKKLEVYLCLPNHISLTEGHCLIIPLQHYTAATLVDEDIWNEIQMFRKALVRMFAEKGLDCVFLETNLNLRKRFHLVYECIPLPKETGDMAPIYFKKAIMESEEEWSMNKKLVDLSTKDIRRSVPKGLPYFSVDFGLQGGYAHVIEDQNKFPHYFGKEIIGGMLDLEPRVWRKGVRENFDDQRKKVLQFAQWWKAFDFTKTKE